MRKGRTRKKNLLEKYKQKMAMDKISAILSLYQLYLFSLCPHVHEYTDIHAQGVTDTYQTANETCELGFSNVVTWPAMQKNSVNNKNTGFISV